MGSFTRGYAAVEVESGSADALLVVQYSKRQFLQNSSRFGSVSNVCQCPLKSTLPPSCHGQMHSLELEL